MEEVPQVKFKVFVTSDNGFVTDAIESAGCDPDPAKEIRDADIFVGVLNFQENESLTLFKRHVEKLLLDEQKRLTISSQTPVVFVYTGITSHDAQNCRSPVENLNALGRELGVNFSVVTTSLQEQSGDGRKELEAKLKEIISNQKEQLLVIREEKKAQQKIKEEATAQSSKPSTVLQGGSASNSNNVARAVPKKVFIASNGLERNKDKFNELITGKHYVIVEDQNDADVIVVACNIKGHDPEQFLNAQCEALQNTKKNVIFTFLSSTTIIRESFTAVADTYSDGLFKEQKAFKETEILKLNQKLAEQGELQQRAQVCEKLLNTLGGETQFEQALAKVSKLTQEEKAPALAPVAQHTSFFKYPEKLSLCHSRQTRKGYAERNLLIVSNENFAVRQKRDVELFVHYMSIRHSFFNTGHVNSKLSKKIEKELAKSLMLKHEYSNYEGKGPCGKKHADYKENGRATIRGKKYDRVALTLKEKLLNRYQHVITQDFLAKLIDLVSCADTIERSFFNYEGKQQDIQNIINAVSDAYWNKFERKDREPLRKCQGLPNDAQSKFDVLYNQELGVVSPQAAR